MPSSKSLFTEAQQKALLDAIAAAEQKTSGEVTLHIDNFCWGDPYKRALLLFRKLNLHETKQRNGVLLYVAIRSHKLALVADEGIYKKVSADYWDGILDLLKTHFKKQEYHAGLCQAIHSIGEQLRGQFPVSAENKNETPDTISFGS
ncbi:MAG: hypothetical protein FD123_3018 [Bacteroidetes bacterium]|nr:MAG: hypothetical protein FD123_3018 [Bacteroidota bacterium]